MMIQNSNPLSMLSGLENGGALQASLQADGGNIEAFTAQLMQQLALLQGDVANKGSSNAGVLSELQANAGALAGHASTQDMQSFAALFGKSLPTAPKSDASIDLEDTLKALSEVLQTLQGIGADAANPAAVETVTGNSALIKDGATETLDDAQQEDAAAIAAAMAVQPAPLTDRQQVDAVAGGDMAVTAAVVGEGGSAAKKNASVGNAFGQREVSGSGQGGNVNQTAVLNGEASAVLVNQDRGFDSAEPNKQNTADDLAILTDTAKGAESDKTPSRMAADIAQLNQAVVADKKVEVPAMNRPLGHPEWNTELGEKLIWMHKQDIPSAELRLNPQHLGPISIKVDVNHDQATVAFTAQHAGVKEAIEAALPKLREMLGEQQLNLVDVNVSQQHSEQRQPSDFFKMASDRGQGNSGQNPDSDNAASQAPVDIVDEIEAGRALASNGLLSLFA